MLSCCFHPRSTDDDSGPKWPRILRNTSTLSSTRVPRGVDANATPSTTKPLRIESLQNEVAPGGASMRRTCAVCLGHPYNGPLQRSIKCCLRAGDAKEGHSSTSRRSPFSQSRALQRRIYARLLPPTEPTAKWAIKNLRSQSTPPIVWRRNISLYGICAVLSSREKATGEAAWMLPGLIAIDTLPFSSAYWLREDEEVAATDVDTLNSSLEAPLRPAIACEMITTWYIRSFTDGIIYDTEALCEREWLQLRSLIITTSTNALRPIRFFLK